MLYGIAGGRTMGRALHRLSAVQIKTLAPGMHNDGHGLYLRVSDTCTRSWIFRFTLGGKTRDMGLGSTHVVSLAAARKRAQELRELRQRGIDPITHQQASVAASRVAKAKTISFREAAERYVAAHENTWSRKHHATYVGTLRDHVYPVIGVLPVSVIDTTLVLQVLESLWRDKTETGSRVRGRIEAILDWARVAGLRDGPNRQRGRGTLLAMLPRRSQVRAVEHYRALDYRGCRHSCRGCGRGSMSARLLEFVILTAARLGEPARRHGMKSILVRDVDAAGRADEDVPPAPCAGEARRCPATRPSGDPARGLIFAGRDPAGQPGRPPLECWCQLAGVPAVHGMRAAFKTWATEQTDFPRELVEMALAHAVGTDVERAYQRSDMFEKRRALMQEWADYCAGGGT
jgi:integrase